MGGMIALAANEHQTGLDPSVVVDFVRQAISLEGNAFFCGLSDRRKSLLANVSPEFLDLLDETNLFEKDSADLFGKKFKQAMLKEFKHDKIMDNLFGPSSHGNRKPFFSPIARERPGLFPGYQCPTGRSSVVRNSSKPRLAASESAVQKFRARNEEALSAERKIAQGISPVLSPFPDARAGLPNLQPTTVAQTGLLSRLKIDFHAITQPARLAGRLAHFVQNWRLISSDPDVLAAVVGYKLAFTTFPVQTAPPRPPSYNSQDRTRPNSKPRSNPCNKKGP